MGYVFDFKDASNYDVWMNRRRNRAVLDLEIQLLLRMLKPLPGSTLLDIGCGTGESLLPMLDAGLRVTGVDPSPYMLDIAKEKTGNRVDLHRGFAEDLPFDDNAFNYAGFFTTLEFVETPAKAIEEAARVAKDRVFIGVLNKYAIKAFQRRVKGMFVKSLYNRAHFFSVWELKRMTRALLGEVPFAWGTVCQFPGTPGRIAKIVEQLRWVQKCPFGAFIGVVITPVPCFRTTPLTLKYEPSPTPETMTGFAGGVSLNGLKREQKLNSGTLYPSEAQAPRCK